MKRTAIVAVSAALGILTGCDGTPPTSAAAPAADAPRIASSYVPPAAPPAPAEPPPPSHNYALEEDGEYGYPPAISDEERNQGVTTKPLVMVRYRGEKNGIYVLEEHDDSGAVFRMECEGLCKYVKTKVIVDGRVIKTATIPNAPASLMHAVFEDAMDGELKPYGKHGG